MPNLFHRTHEVVIQHLECDVLIVRRDEVRFEREDALRRGGRRFAVHEGLVVNRHIHESPQRQVVPIRFRMHDTLLQRCIRVQTRDQLDKRSTQ